MRNDKIIVRGAREHNLKNVSVELPRDSLIVMTGLSGSGKSSLAFDCLLYTSRARRLRWWSASSACSNAAQSPPRLRR